MAAAGAIAFLACSVEGAYAQTTLIAYVSGNGVDNGICDSSSSPCRTFQYAVDHTAGFGEIKALDPANYGPVIIGGPVSITGVEGAGIYLSSPRGPAITIRRGAAPVLLTHLTIDGHAHTPGPLGNIGIVINGGPVTIADCTIRHFLDAGIDIQDSTYPFLIAHTLVAANAFGIRIAPGQSSASSLGSAGVLDHVRLHGNNQAGLTVGVASAAKQTQVTAIDIAATDNGQGIVVESNSALTLGRSTITGNAQYGISIAESGGYVGSFGDNDISGNGQDVYGQLSHVAAQ
jgi:hypothetical protein